MDGSKSHWVSILEKHTVKNCKWEAWALLIFIYPKVCFFVMIIVAMKLLCLFCLFFFPLHSIDQSTSGCDCIYEFHISMLSLDFIMIYQSTFEKLNVYFHITLFVCNLTTDILVFGMCNNVIRKEFLKNQQNILNTFYTLIYRAIFSMFSMIQSYFEWSILMKIFFCCVSWKSTFDLSNWNLMTFDHQSISSHINARKV